MEDSDLIINACDQHGVHLMIGFVRRFDAEWLSFAHMVRNNAIGRPIVWRFSAGTEGPDNNWRYEAGSVITEWAVHYFDFAKHIFGTVDSIKASCQSLKSGEKATDTCSAIITYSGYDQLFLSLTWGLPEGAKSAISNDAFGRGGVVLWPESIRKEDMPFNIDLKKQGAFVVDKGGGNREIVRYERNDMYLDQMNHFIECLYIDRTPFPSGQDGRDALDTAIKVLKNSNS
jgi:predicted dehydrogenase